MPASQPSYEDTLDIAVRDLPPPAPIEHDASIALLRFPCAELGTVDTPSDTLDVAAARSAVFEANGEGEHELGGVLLGDPELDDALFEDAQLDDDDELDDAPFEDAQLDHDDEFDDAPFERGLTDAPREDADDMAGDTLVDAAGATFVASTPEAAPEADAALEADVAPEAEPAPSRVDPIRVPLWSGINSFAYAVSRGLRGMGQSPLVQLIAVGTMAVCMLLLGTTTLILQNAQRVAHDLGVDTPVTVYMQPDSDAMTIAQLRARIAELPEVAAVEHVTPEAALARLADGLGQGDSIAAVGEAERAELLAGIDASNLPDSLEIALVPGVDLGFADALATRIGGMAGVDEVSALGPWVQEVERMLKTLRWLAIGIGVLVSLACLAIVWSTIRLGVFARRAEIDILRLVGGTSRFVRGPFVVEGVVQGVLGTALAIAGLWLGFELIRPFLERGMALVFAAGSLRFFTMIELGLALGFGAMIGLIGSRAAVARHA
jgi:cell division protein FtsX